MSDTIYSVDFYEGQSSNLPSTGVQGTFYYTLDTEELYRAKADGSIKKVNPINLHNGSGENSLKQNTCSTSSSSCVAMGRNNVAGLTGLAIETVNFWNDFSDTIYAFHLSDTRSASPEDVSLVTAVTTQWEEGDVVSAFYRYNFYTFGTIDSIEGRTVYVKMDMPIDSRWNEVLDATLDADNDINGFFNMSKQDITGPWDGGIGSTVFGLDNKSLALGSFVAGGENTGFGTYSAVFGSRNIMTAGPSIVAGEGNEVNHQWAAAFGRNLKTDFNCQTVVGHNNAPAPGAYFVVGTGNDDDHRKNTLTVTQDNITANGNLSVTGQSTLSDVRANTLLVTGTVDSANIPAGFRVSEASDRCYITLPSGIRVSDIALMELEKAAPIHAVTILGPLYNSLTVKTTVFSEERTILNVETLPSSETVYSSSTITLVTNGGNNLYVSYKDSDGQVQYYGSKNAWEYESNSVTFTLDTRQFYHFMEVKVTTPN